MAVTGRGLKGYTAAEYDVAAEIWQAVDKLEELGIDVNFVWVRGHKDDKDREKELTRESALNVDCNLRAGIVRAHPPRGLEQCLRSPRYPVDAASLLTGGGDGSPSRYRSERRTHSPKKR